MNCGHCAQSVTEEVGAIPGVTDVRVDLASGKLVVISDTDVAFQAIEAAVQLQPDVLLIDLWATEPGGVYADQTWMAFVGTPTARALEVWSAVRDARDAAVRLVQESAVSGRALRGAEVDDAARQVIAARGFGDRFIHRTGHSIDPRSLHGAGPHLDNLETREERRLVPGIGFSIEPGIYLPGELGMRSEVNAFLRPRRAIITPTEHQRELIVL